MMQPISNRGEPGDPRLQLVLELTQSPTEDARALIEELEAELSGPYSAEQRHGYSVDRVFQPNIVFFIAHLDGEAVGCGGVAFEDGLAEVKRMYVRPRHRGRGVGQAILARLEDEARARGVRRLVLETGDVLHAAVRLYTGAGFTPCSAFGVYTAMPASAIERSIFLEKRIESQA
jgi:putative acetyltransferase